MPPKNTMGDFLPFAASQEAALHADPELGDIVLAMPYIKRWVRLARLPATSQLPACGGVAHPRLVPGPKE
jgi:hypothetical protein